jgi:hypothetical protein
MGLSEAVVAGTAVLALIVVLLRGPWHVTRHVVTIAHEGGHALVALLVGRRVSGIRLNADTSGVTLSRGRAHGPGMIATALAGYVAPSLVGLGFAALLHFHETTALLWLTVALLLAVLVFVRNFYGALSVVVTGAAVFAVSWFLPATVQAGFAYFITWFLLLAGIRPVWELQRKRARGRAPDSDADQLGRLTGTAGLLWVTLFGLVALVCLGLGAALLVPLSTVHSLLGRV